MRTQKEVLYKRMKGFYGVNKQKELLRAAVCLMPVLKPGFRRLTLDEFILLEKELKR